MIGEAVAQPTDLVVAHALEAASQQHDLPPALLRSLAFHDSKRLDLVHTDNPVAIADAAAKQLALWFKKYRGSWVHVLAAWRIGPGRVDNMLRGKTWQLTDVTHDYISNVLAGAGLPQPFNLKQCGTWV